MQYFGRSEGASGELQLLADHLRNVAQRAGQFAEEAGLARELGEWAGRLHDLGKYSYEFQAKLLNAKNSRDQVVHSYQGAVIALDSRSLECALAIAAHHAGLKKLSDLKSELDGLETTIGLTNTRLRNRAAAFVKLAEQEGIVSGRPPASVGKNGEEMRLELRTRMLLSCLADADRLDAEAWTTPERELIREAPRLDPETRLATVRESIQAVAAERAGRADPKVLEARSRVLEACLDAADRDRGFFSLTVPTGGGKTLASLAFALKHAHRQELRRVIFVVPFLTIIEQNADAIRRSLGDHDGSFVLEHHSNVAGSRKGDDDDSTEGTALRQRLLAENWDSPVIMTSAVQFFESLFSDHPTKLRKVHNIARSVIVFDEAQTFPPELLRPLVGMLRQLVEEYGCSVVFCTATQPALAAPLRGKEDEALLPPGTIHEIMPEPERLFDQLRRVRVVWRTAEPTAATALAAEMLQEPAALAIVNTKRDAREVFQALLANAAWGASHLSTRMCPEHRRQVLRAIRERLSRDEPCHVASTQLVEAGVDVDFPAVWRAMAPLDSVAQAAGRCNREGKLDFGHVIVFQTEDQRMPGGAYRRGASITAGMLSQSADGVDIAVPAEFTEYFVRLYNTEDLDARHIAGLRKSFDFPTVAEKFKLIEETTAVLVPYGEGERWRDRVQSGEKMTRGKLREMQPFMVSLYEIELRKALESGDVVRTADGIHVFTGRYDGQLGLVLSSDPLVD